MIVAYNALSVRPGVDDGAATYSVNLLRHLPDALPGDRIVAFVRPGERRFDGVSGLEPIAVAVGASPVVRVAAELFSLARRVRATGADVFISPNESLPLRLRSPTVAIAQNLVYHREDSGAFLGGNARERAASRLQAAYYRLRMTRAYARADAVVAVSGETAAVLAAAGLDRAKTHVVPEGSDSVLLPEPGAERTRERRLLVVSTLAPYKNHERALDVFARVRRTWPELELVVVGGDWRGYGDRVRAYADSLGVTDAARFVGSVSACQLAELYERSGLLLHLSGCESFGLPVVEAMRYGLPVVAAERSSLPEVAGGAAVLVDPDDVDGTAAAVEALLGDRERLTDLAARGRARAAELTWAATAAGVAAVIRNVSRGAG